MVDIPDHRRLDHDGRGTGSPARAGAIARRWEERMLEALGVDPSAETIYLAMLRQPNAGRAALAGSLGWTEEQVDAALDRLAQLSLLRPSFEDPRVLRPVSPAVGLEKLLARQEAELARRQHQIEEGRAALETLLIEFCGREAGTTVVEELVGLDAVREGLERLALEARYEVLAFAPDGAQTIDSMKASRPLNRYLLGKGIRMRTLYLTSVRNDPQTTAHAQWLTESGAELRTAPVLPLRMLVVDRILSVVPLNPENTAAGACVVRGPGVAAALNSLFDLVWRDATPWGARPPATAPTPTDQERALLRLLMRGDTDEQAARKLGVSTRTVGRMAADLMGRLHARSRFQAGALAVANGWLAAEGAVADRPAERPVTDH
jgi:DNA-binding CsgD family transcriptional regulator